MDPIAEEILRQLAVIKGNGEFVVSGVNKVVLPGLSIKGVGEIGMPLTPLQLKAIIEVAHKAPFGKGSETILDPEVRSAWEIDAEKLSFHHDKWESRLLKILKKIKQGFNLENQTVGFSLYKMLIYEEGDFFLPHKDSEKEAGMFGTLIIGLPSQHTGGELLVRFDGKEEVIDFSKAASHYKMPYVAFYADCEHEIKPITSGYRVCLVYNLVQTSPNSVPALSDFAVDIQNLSEQLVYWEKREDAFPKAILLGHEYTPANFSRKTLKRDDIPRAEALLAAASQAGYFACLGLLTHYQMGELIGGPEYGYGRRSWRNQEWEATEAMMGEIFESYSTINNWAEESNPHLGELTLYEKNILTQFEIGVGDPTEQEAETYTGNAGMTMEYWYHYGALILWPKSKHVDILANQSLDIQLDWLKHYLENWEDANSPVYTKKWIMNLSEKDWENKRYLSLDFSWLSDALIQLRDEELLLTYGFPTLAIVFDKMNVQSWVSLLNVFGQEVFEPLIQKIADSGEISKLKHLLNILEALAIEAVSPFVQNQLEKLPDYLSISTLHILTPPRDRYQPHKLERSEIISEIIYGVLILSKWKNTDDTWIAKVVKSISQELPRDYVNSVLVPVLLKHPYKTGQLYRELFKLSWSSLEKRVAQEPQPLPDWKRPIPKSSDYFKETWEMLAEFLNSPTIQIFDYQKAQQYRTEVESAIRNAEIDLRTETIRKGSPHTLRIIKTQAAYKKKHKEWMDDVELLKKVEKLGKDLSK